MSNHRGSITLHFTGGKGTGIIEGNDVGKNSPGQRWIASINKKPMRMPCMNGAKILNNLLLGGFCGHTKINRDPSIMEKNKNDS